MNAAWAQGPVASEVSGHVNGSEVPGRGRPGGPGAPCKGLEDGAGGLETEFVRVKKLSLEKPKATPRGLPMLRGLWAGAG